MIFFWFCFLNILVVFTIYKDTENQLNAFEYSTSKNEQWESGSIYRNLNCCFNTISYQRFSCCFLQERHTVGKVPSMPGLLKFRTFCQIQLRYFFIFVEYNSYVFRNKLLQVRICQPNQHTVPSFKM